MGGPDTFMQAAAAFFDFDSDEDGEEGNAEQTPIVRKNVPQLPSVAHEKSQSNSFESQHLPKEKTNDEKKKRGRPKKQTPKSDAWMKKERIRDPAMSRADVCRSPVKKPVSPKASGWTTKRPGVDVVRTYTDFEKWLVAKKGQVTTNNDRSKPQAKKRGRPPKVKKRGRPPKVKKRGRPPKKEWPSSDETDGDSSDQLDGCRSGSEAGDRDDTNCLYGCEQCRYATSGCVKCRREDPNVQRPKIIWDPTRLHPQEHIPPGPVFYPSEAEFANPFGYIAQIRTKAERYGICMIVPPESWTRPADPLRNGADDYEFYPKRQLVSSLCVRSEKFDEDPGLNNKEGDGSSSDDEFGFTTSDMPFTFRSFKAFADWAHSMHFNRALDGSKQDKPSMKQMEGEFWRIVEGGDTTEFETFYGSDLDASQFPSAFTQPPQDKEYKANWNVSLWPRSVDSVLRYLPGKELINGVMIPWVYFGSSLSAFCWHVEDHALYSINYLHKGASKMWYGVPSASALDFESAMVDAFPKLFEADPRLLHRLVTHLSPAELRKRGIPVYRIEHRPGAFVITFPNGYHGGFNCGWNCAEAVNFAPPDWLPAGSDVIRKYRSQKRPITFSHDALLLQIVSSVRESDPNRMEPLAVKYAVGELHLRSQEEARRRAVAHETGISKAVRMHGGKDTVDDSELWTNSEEQDCEVCKCDLFLSAVVSVEHPGTGVCPEHAAHFASDRILLYRHSISELEELIEEAKSRFPDSQEYIERAIQRMNTPRVVKAIHQGPFRIGARS